VIEISKVQVRRGQENTTGIPQLDSGEFGWAEDTENLYIGKRVVDGASNDDNTRILTDKDISGLFDFIKQNNTSTVISAYTYRHGVPYLDTYTTTTTVQVKLDTINPSITDFGVIPTVDINNPSPDITDILNTAITAIFNNGDPISNPIQRQDARRILIIPAGNYSVSGPIYLPPFTHLKGSGPGITTLSISGFSDHTLFQTVDAFGVYLGNTNGTLMQSGDLSAQEVTIEDMTLQYSSTNNISSPVSLISLDNARNVYISNVEFIADDGIGRGINSFGITIRCSNGPTLTGINLSQDTYIKNCNFHGLDVGVVGQGPVSRVTIIESSFQALNNGIYLEYLDPSIGAPTDFVISRNRFRDIFNEAIYVGENSGIRTNHISSENLFVNVGNRNQGVSGATQGDGINTTQTSVITFLSDGNKTVKDTFNRRTVADQAILQGLDGLPDFHYNLLVKGRSVIDDGAVYTATITTNTITNIIGIPLYLLPDQQNQMATVEYQISNPDTQLSRKGSLLVNIAPNGTTTLSDKYNYSENVSVVLTGLTALPGSGLDTFVISESTTATFTDPILLTVNTSTFAYVKSSIEQRTGSWYFSQSNTTTSLITNINIDNVNSNYIITTVSSSPQFNYDPAVNTGTWSLLYGPPVIEFDSVLQYNKGYTTIVCTTSSSAFSITPSLIEYTVKLDT
jgi:hypothetical protein